MNVDPLGASGATAPTDRGPGALGALDSDAFLRLLVAQLRYQNPMNPGDGTELLRQTAQFTTVETLQRMAETEQRLMGLQQVTLAMSVVGKSVSAIDPEGGSVVGVVDSVRFTADGPMLSVGGVEVPLDNVLSVTAPPPPASA